MKSIVKLMYILFVAIVMSGCANKKEKAITAREYYINKGYDVIYPPTLSCFDVDDDYYILFVKNDTLYLDTKFKFDGRSAYKIYPNEKGLVFKTLELSLDNGITGAWKPVENKNDYIKQFEIIFHNKKDKNGKDLLYSIDHIYNPSKEKIYYLIGEKEALVLEDDFKEWGGHHTVSGTYIIERFSHERTFTFADLFDNSQYEVFVSLENYPFTIVESFSLKDLSFSLSKMKLKKEDYPWKEIRERIEDYSWISQDDEYFYIPGEKPCIDIIKEYVDRDIDKKLIEWYEEEERVWLEEEGARIQNEAIDYEKMLRDFRHNPIKAKETYQVGNNMVLKIKIERINRSYKEGYAYKLEYDLSLLGLLQTTIYTNDVNFTKIDYPCTVIITANSKDHSLYDFTDAKLWFYGD